MAGSPLVKRLGIKPGQRVLVMNAPGMYRELLGEVPDGVEDIWSGIRFRPSAVSQRICVRPVQTGRTRMAPARLWPMIRYSLPSLS